MKAKTDTRKLDALISTSHERTTKLVLTFAELTRDEAKKNAPVKTGELRDSIQAYIVGQARARVEAEADHAAAVELGTPPHEIRPRYKKALYWPDAEHPVKRVRHPGTSPQPYMKPALERLIVEINTGLQNTTIERIMMK